MTWADLGYYLAIVIALCAFLAALVGIALWDEIHSDDEAAGDDGKES
jgi:hypothetical protein